MLFQLNVHLFVGEMLFFSYFQKKSDFIKLKIGSQKGIFNSKHDLQVIKI